MNHTAAKAPETEVARAKAVLRATVRAELARISPAQRERASAEVRDRLRASSLWRHARGILAYLARADEVDLNPLLEEAQRGGRMIALPQFDPQTGVYVPCQVKEPEKDLILGKFRIPEPALHCRRVAAEELDLILVPGLAFDKNGHRLGRGRGFYDRLLASVSKTKCGVGFDEQLQADIPVEPHDVLLDDIVMPSCWLTVSSPRHGDELVG